MCKISMQCRYYARECCTLAERVFVLCVLSHTNNEVESSVDLVLCHQILVWQLIKDSDVCCHKQGQLATEITS